jgi:hypothetical protein
MELPATSLGVAHGGPRKQSLHCRMPGGQAVLVAVPADALTLAGAIGFLIGSLLMLPEGAAAQD